MESPTLLGLGRCWNFALTMLAISLFPGSEFPTQYVDMSSRSSSRRSSGTVSSWLEFQEVQTELPQFAPLFRFFLNIPLTGSISAITPCLEMPGRCGSCRRCS